MHYHHCCATSVRIWKWFEDSCKFSSLWEKIRAERARKRAGSANKGIIIIVEITIIKLCACWQCAIIMSAFCHWIGISAEWLTTKGSWEHLLMCQRCAVCMVQKILVRSCSFSKTTFVWLIHCSMSLKRYEVMLFSHQWESADQGLQLEKEVVRMCHKNEKRVYAPKWKASVPWNTTKNGVTISWLLPP